MTVPSTGHGTVELGALDGSNPLGFLTALGTLVTVRHAGGVNARLRWKHGLTWIPVLEEISARDDHRFSEIVAEALRGQSVPEDAESARKAAEDAFNAAKKNVDDKKKQIRGRRLKGKERDAAIDAEVRPLEQTREEKRRDWLQALAKAVPRPELALGKRIDCTHEEYRDHAHTFRERAGSGDRDTVDFLAAFASDACLDKYGRTEATPFCFITGSGHQYFLDTVRQLTEHATSERVHQALFEPWAYRDETLSLRWDPIEDRRYALMDRDPTASDNTSRTVWMANLLAYRALVLFPSAPSGVRLATTAWTEIDGAPTFTWPIWEAAADPDTIRSLLWLPELRAGRPDRSALQARGIAAAYRARRIKVGEGTNYKINFSPARGISFNEPTRPTSASRTEIDC